MAEATPTPTPELVTIHWPNGAISRVAAGSDWLAAAEQARVPIPTGCLGGSCGACELTVNGETLRACIAVVTPSDSALTVESWDDPSW